MRFATKKRRVPRLSIPVGAALVMLPLVMSMPVSAEDVCDTAGLKLPQGFCATVFADDIGHPRHISVAADGTLYANTVGTGKYSSGGSIVAMKDSDSDGKADMVKSFGPKRGGTGIAIYKDGLYAESGDSIVRYVMTEGEIVPKGEPEVVVSGIPIRGGHTARPFAIDPDGNLFIDVGSATNACQEQDRTEGSPGERPCAELKTRAGIWRYDANKTDQKFSAAERYATGLRNAEGIDFDADGRIFATQHGRDQLHENWPALFSSKQGSELPAEELVLVKEGGDYGWPYCYYDGEQKKLVLAPEYGGDGQKVGDCGKKIPPVAAFPAHWAPNDMKIYKGTQFPESYRGGAFIAFHGSWNRSYGPQEGFNVVFQPLSDGKASGAYTIFADDFSGNMKETGAPDHRPTGLAVGPDGALYVSDDHAGRIWRIVYKG